MQDHDLNLLRYNCQPYSATKEIIRDILDGSEYQGVVSDTIMAEYQNISDILVSDACVAVGINAEYLGTLITGKHVFAPLVGCHAGVPCNMKVPMLVLDDNEMPEGETDYNYKEVDFTDETTIADIYKNAWKYRYDTYLDKYVRLPEQGAKQQLAKFILAKEIANMTGNPYERLADYGRIILFLLSKVTLTAEEQTQLAPLLAYAPTVTDINEVLYREEQVQAKVKQMKENFDEYIGITETQPTADANTEAD